MNYKRPLIVSVLLLLALGFTEYISRAENVPTKRPFSKFPLKIDDWQGIEDRFEQEIYNILGVDDSFLGNFKTADGRYVQLYIGFYESQREGDIIHSPRNCMPGAGWNVAQISKETVKDAKQKAGEAEVIKLVLQKGVQKQIVFYWFHSRGRIISSEYYQKIYLVIDSIFRHRTDGSFVRLIAPVVDNNEAGAVKNLKDFAEVVMPVLYDFIPS